MATQTNDTQQTSELVAELNDLLQLDHDAVQAYTLAMELLEKPAYREAIRVYREDHRRHIEALTRLIREFGGTPMELPHMPTGAFKLAVQAAGRAGGDLGVLLAFKANERQVRDKYRRHANRQHPENVALVLQRNANDEQTHYAWVLETVEDLGAGPETRAGRAEERFERMHAAVADRTEAAERRLMSATGEMRRTVMDQVRRNPMRAALVALGAGFVIAEMMGGRD